jgi:osmotically inducible protein OsmC
MAIRTGTAEWKGSLEDGSGTIGSGSGTIAGDYSAESRFAEGGGTNPEELLGAAHASCFSMFLGLVLGEQGHPAESIRTEARVHILKQGEGYAVTRIDLVTTGRVPGIDDGTFQAAAQNAKENCPISHALGAVPEINVEATLES